MKRTGVAILAAMVLAGCGAASKAATATSTSTTASKSTATTMPTTTTTTAPKTWQTVAALSGTGNKTGTNFHLTSADARLTYSAKGEVTAIYVMDSSQNLDKDGGIPEVSCDSACADTTSLRKSAGDYYLIVKTTGAYTVSVEQLK